MFKRSTTSECGVTQHTTTTIQYERYNTDGAKICSRKQRTKYDRRYDEEANRARRRGSVSGKPERHTRENFPHTTIHHHSHSGGTKSQCETNSTRGIRRLKPEEKLVKRRLSAASSWDEAQALAKIEHESTQKGGSGME